MRVNFSFFQGHDGFRVVTHGRVIDVLISSKADGYGARAGV
jgi:hypothetical protein